MFEELKKTFIAEVKELLQNTEKNLLLLEKDKLNAKYVQEIFRSMHTIKGAAGVYGLERTVKLAHSFENIFAKIRDGKIAANNEIISLALNSLDVIIALIEAKSEEEIPVTKTDVIFSKIENFLKQSSVKSVEKKQDRRTFYILFEPDADIIERGIKIEQILEDFDEIEHKIITKITDENRIDNNKYQDFYEIIVAAEYSKDEISAIFLFTPKEFNIEQIVDFDIFQDENFIDFYENAVKILPFSEQRLELIKNYGKNIEFEEQADENTAVDKEQIIGADEIQSYINQAKENYLRYIKVPAKKLDELLSLVSELIISNSQLRESVANGNNNAILQLTENIDKTINSIKENTLNLRLIPIKNILPPYYRVVRDLALKLNKKIEFIADGIDTLVDKTIIDKLSVPLMHLVRNSIDHGIEYPEERIKKGKSSSGIIRFIAYYSHTNVILQIQDDGKGIDPDFVKRIAIEKGFIKPEAKLTKKEIYDLLFLPGFSTAKDVTDISGRGVGMDAIKKAILDLRGDIEIDSEIELGTSITIKLPLTLSIIETLHVSSGNLHFLIPLSNIVICSKIKQSEMKYHSGERIIVDGELLPFIDVKAMFKINGEEKEEKNLIIIQHGKQKYGLIFDRIHGEYQAVIKNLGTIFNNLDFLIGASILGNGAVAYILDTYKLLKKIQ